MCPQKRERYSPHMEQQEYAALVISHILLDRLDDVIVEAFIPELPRLVLCASTENHLQQQCKVNLVECIMRLGTGGTRVQRSPRHTHHTRCVCDHRWRHRHDIVDLRMTLTSGA